MIFQQPARSIDPASTKQMLLVFDTIHFLDPVDDEEWRACLMAEMLDRRFTKYQAIAKVLPTLVSERAVARQDPHGWEPWPARTF